MRYFKYKGLKSTEDPVLREEYKKFIEKQSESYQIPPLVAGDSERGTGHVFSDLSLVCDAPCIGSADS